MSNNFPKVSPDGKQRQLPDPQQPGSVLAEAGQLEDAMLHIQKAIELDPDNGTAHINLGHLLEVTGHRQEAIEQLRLGLQVAAKNAMDTTSMA